MCIRDSLGSMHHWPWLQALGKTYPNTRVLIQRLKPWLSGWTSGRFAVGDFQVSADHMKLVLGSGDICLHCFMKKIFKKQSAKFVQNPSSFTKVMAKHILVCFLCPTVYGGTQRPTLFWELSLFWIENVILNSIRIPLKQTLFPTNHTQTHVH